MSIDGERVAISAVVTAGLAAGVAEALLYHSTHTSHAGPTSATLSDAAAVIGGACLGLAVGALAAAAWVRRGSRLASGLVVGALGFLAVTPFLWRTFSSDLSAGEKFGGLVVLAIPAAFFVAVGALIGAGVRQNRPG